MSGITSLANDPFAAIRRLNFGVTGTGTHYDIGQAHDDTYQGIPNVPMWGLTGGSTVPHEFGVPQHQQFVPLDAQGNELTGTNYRPEDVAMVRAMLTDPTGNKGRHSRINAVYRPGADGQWEMEETPHQFNNQSTWTGFRDAGMPIAATAAAIMGAPYLSAMYGGMGLGTAASAAATGATIGGGGAALGGGNTSDILRGALIGGIGGYAGSSLGDYLEFQNQLSAMDAAQAAGGAGSAAGGAAGGAGSAAGMGNNIGLSGAGQTIPVTGSYASLPTHSLGSIGTGLGGFAGAAPSVVNPQGPVETTPLDPNRQQIEVVGERGSTGPSMGETMAGLPGAIYGNNAALNPNETGRIDVVANRDRIMETPDEFHGPMPMFPPSMMGPMPAPNQPEIANLPAPAPVDQPMQMGTEQEKNPFLEWAKKNPVQAIKMLGILGGAAGGSRGGGSGGAGGNLPSQAGITANQPAAFQRQYVAPPPGYRPGFDPEHTFFTGIGSVGVGG